MHRCHRLRCRPPAAASCLLSPGAFPLAHLSELCLVELRSSEQLQALLRHLSPATLPVLLRLALSAPLAVRLQDGGLLGSLELPGLQHLALDDIELKHGLASLTQLQQLTELCVGLSASPFGHQQGLSCAAPPGVAHLSSLRRLQALALPQLGEAERCSLSLLTSLTRLAFAAAGRGAVGPSLRTLRQLAHLHISLAHVHEHFIVLHPRLEWAALRQLGSLQRLSITHLAAYSFFPAPEATWSQEAPVAAEAERLLGSLPLLEALQLRLSFCRLAEDQATPEGEPEEVIIASDNATSPDAPSLGSKTCRGTSPADCARTYRRTIELVPLRTPGHRRRDDWYSRWWQSSTQCRLEEAAAAAPGGSADEAAQAAEAAVALHRRLADGTEVAGWAAIRPGAYRTHDTLVTYSLTHAVA
ncbi:hypothetical protein ABPG77_007607 [Micractinium sp. CCAP 211/92]